MKTAFAFLLMVTVIAISCAQKTPRSGAGLGVTQTDPQTPQKSDDGGGEGEDGEYDDFL